MAQVIVRNIEETVKRRLKQRAASHGRSMEEEIREILRGVVNEPPLPQTGLGSRIAALFRNQGLSDNLEEVHGEARPAVFDP
jgi:plasmid stability protein